MTTANTSAVAAGGYWTIQLINRNRDEVGRRYACHAHDEDEARHIAGHLVGALRAAEGYDYHRIDNPAGRHALDIGMGQSVSIDSRETWTVLQSARRSA